MPDDDEFSHADAGSPVIACALRQPEQQQKLHWIEIELVGEDGSPVGGEEYEIKLPDGILVKGYLDEKGWARVEGIAQPGQCEISMPRLDRDAWNRLGGPLPARSAGESEAH
jgi:hypothetical protein